MPSYSSKQLYKDWRYAVGEEFTTADGQPFPYAKNGHLHWDDELVKLEFDQQQSYNACVSTDGKHLAVAVEHNIHIIETSGWATLCILRGHVEEIDALVFAPHDPNILVSSAWHEYPGPAPKREPIVIVWNINEYQERYIGIRNQASLDEVSAAAAATAASILVEKGLSEGDELRQRLEKAFGPAVSRIVASELIRDNLLLHGRISTSFGSQVFSPSGRRLAYIPGAELRSNDIDVWDIKIVSANDFHSDLLTLHGHTDSIMWTGWNVDESLFASVAWDNTIRVWDGKTGEQRFCFTTTNQNWTGGFSPNSKYFAATCGNGSTHIYSMDDGSEIWVFEREGARGWRRTLDWHPNSKWLAVGGESLAPVYLLDVERQEVLQKRSLSPEKSHAEPGRDAEVVRKMLGGMLGVRKVRFMDGGKKLAVWTMGDCSIELYDLDREVKWRFARGGTDDDVDNTKWKDEKGDLKVANGYKMLTWEDGEKGLAMLASVDCDGIRIWSVRLTNS